MNPLSPILLLSLLLLLPAHLTAQEAPAASRGKMGGAKMAVPPAWFKESFLDISEDVSEAADEEKHVILFMEMNGCPYCYKMIEENFKNAPYKAFIQEHFDVIALNTKGDREVALDEETSANEKEIAALLKVRYTPTVIFLNQDNKPVARINGYRNVQEFKGILNYVKEKAYQEQKLPAYLDARKKTGGYAFRPHPRLQEIQDLSSVTDRPLALLFEDSACVACDALHDGHLKDPEVDQALTKMAFVRLDALSETPHHRPPGQQDHGQRARCQARHHLPPEHRPVRQGAGDRTYREYALPLSLHWCAGVRRRAALRAISRQSLPLPGRQDRSVAEEREGCEYFRVK